MALKELIQNLTSWFDKENINYALIGGFALQAYGYVRSTRDIDFLILEKNQDLVISHLEQIGFKTLHLSSGYSNHLHPIDSLRIDFVYVDELTGSKIFTETTSTILFDDTPLRVVSARHLIALKLFAAKNDPDRILREFADIKELVKNTHLSRQVLKDLLSTYGFEDWIDKVENGN